MLQIIFAIAFCCLSGCTIYRGSLNDAPAPYPLYKTVETAQEPDTEWILAQYQGQDEAAVNQRRLREGW